MTHIAQIISPGDSMAVKDFAEPHQTVFRADRNNLEGCKIATRDGIIPKPQTCEFCGKKLYHSAFNSFFVPKKVVGFSRECELCDCERAVSHRDELARKTREKNRADRIDELTAKSGMSPNERLFTFENYRVTADNKSAYEAGWSYAQKFSDNLSDAEKRGLGLYLEGSCGTGKTFLSCCIANALIQQGIEVRCMTMIALLDKIKDTFSDKKLSNKENGLGDASEREVIEQYINAPLLIIDDLGKEYPTEWSISQMYKIIDARIRAFKPIIVSTNYNAQELIRRLTPPKTQDEKTAAAIVDRLSGACCICEMYFRSMRRFYG